MKLQREPESLDDRKSILAFIGADRPRAAMNVDDLIVEARCSLKRFPLKVRVGRTPGTRELVIPNTRYTPPIELKAIPSYCCESSTVRVAGQE